MATDNCITIPLTQGYTTKISAEDKDLALVKWCAWVMKGRAYAVKSHPSRRLHREILERKLGRKLEKGEVCDHIDNDPLNNCRDNIRLATFAENVRNQKKNKTNTTGYKGVRRDRNRWRAQIMVNGKYIHLGMFGTPEEAYEAYKTGCKVYHGKFGRSE